MRFKAGDKVSYKNTSLTYTITGIKNDIINGIYFYYVEYIVYSKKFPLGLTCKGIIPKVSEHNLHLINEDEEIL